MADGINIYDAYRPCWENNQNGASMKFSEMLKEVHRINKGQEGRNLSLIHI